MRENTKLRNKCRNLQALCIKYDAFCTELGRKSRACDQVVKEMQNWLGKLLFQMGNREGMIHSLFKDVRYLRETVNPKPTDSQQELQRLTEEKNNLKVRLMKTHTKLLLARRKSSELEIENTSLRCIKKVRRARRVAMRFGISSFKAGLRARPNVRRMSYRWL